MFFVGIDLAWSPRNNTGISISKGGEVVKLALVKSDEEIVNTIMEEISNKACWIAIDAPLTVPNAGGSRPVDKLITRLFRSKHAGCYPANREILKKYGQGKPRGEEIVKLLKREGFEENPYAKPRSKTRVLFEVFPHPAIVELFSLDKILEYKARKGRTYEYRWKELDKYKKALASLADSEPPFTVPKELLKESKAIGRSLKNEEDLLDALLCNYLAYFHWYWGGKKSKVFGDLKSGHIVVPYLYQSVNNFLPTSSP